MRRRKRKRRADPAPRTTMARKRDEGVPPLRNEDVTGLTEEKQDAVIRESGTAPDRGDAAHEFLDEQQDQAQDTAPSAKRRGVGRVPESPRDPGRPGIAGPERGTELEKHWDPDRKSS
jgi:hypothetical protein